VKTLWRKNQENSSDRAPLNPEENLFDFCWDQVPVIVSIVVMCVIALLFIPIFGLTGFHIVLGRQTE
jgi:hypothetical protein